MELRSDEYRVGHDDALDNLAERLLKVGRPNLIPKLKHELIMLRLLDDAVEAGANQIPDMNLADEFMEFCREFEDSQGYIDHEIAYTAMMTQRIAETQALVAGITRNITSALRSETVIQSGQCLLGLDQ